MEQENTNFLLFAATLVMLMVPAVGFFYGGMVRSKNVVSTIIESFSILAIVSVLWILVGYSLVFAEGSSSWIGGFEWAGLQNLPLTSPFSEKTHIYAFILFQGMFAAITPAIINGSVVERVRFPALLLFVLCWSLLVYCPIAHWVWNPAGFLATLGALDFAGGAVIHISSGFAGLAACLYVGRRKTQNHKLLPHNLTLTIIGGTLLWFGWFGFNGGSSLLMEKFAGNAFLTTHLAAACGCLGWLAVEWWHTKVPSALGLISGAIAGLVGITPAAGYVSILAAIPIGAITGVVCYGFIIAKHKIFRYDDTLDVFGLHGMGGVTGALLTGFFATQTMDPSIPNGLFYGNPHQLVVQAIAVLVCATFSFTITWLLLWIINWITPIRARGKDEDIGMDLSQHGEQGYRLSSDERL